MAMIRRVLLQPHFKTAPRGMPIYERANDVTVVTNPSDSAIVTLDPDRNKVIADYYAKEIALYNSGTNLADDFSAAAKFWGSISNPDGTINSSYGHLVWRNKSMGDARFENPRAFEAAMDGNEFASPAIAACSRTPWEWARQSLESDQDSRQAIVKFALPEHYWKGNKDQVCTLHGSFMIRHKALHLTVVMRSNDLVLGTVYDMPWFCSLIDRMLAELKPVYPDLRKGTYTHVAHSLHIYERDLEKAKKMAGL